jgi:hypothetical protein
MSIRKAVAWLFEVGDGAEADAGPPPIRREDTGPPATFERHLYGQAEAIRVLYQTARAKERPRKPPRPKRGRGLSVARYMDSLSASLSEPLVPET